MRFIQFVESKEKEDVQATLKKLPGHHSNLINKYKIVFQNGNTIKSDYVGEIDEKNKKIIVSAPWNYSREYTLLHEIAHLIYNKILSDELKKQWAKIVKNTKEEKAKDSDEELFCMAYANFYATNKVVIHTHKKWEEFIKQI